jgi:predicted DNA-binding transcriptional regulator AlpA
MSIVIVRSHAPDAQPEKLPPCRFPLPSNLRELPGRQVPVIQQIPREAIPAPERNWDEDRLLNARQVAERLGVSERWVRDHTTRRSPKIRGVKLGMMMRYRRADIDRFMQELDTQTTSRGFRKGV